MQLKIGAGVDGHLEQRLEQVAEELLVVLQEFLVTVDVAEGNKFVRTTDFF